MFFHFVGATPGSTDLAFFLQRLSREINVSKVINLCFALLYYMYIDNFWVVIKIFYMVLVLANEQLICLHCTVPTAQYFLCTCS